MTRIREATFEDVEVLQRYAVKLFSEHLPGIYRSPTPSLEDERAFVRAHVEPANSVMLLAEQDGAIVGLLGFLGRQRPQEAHVGALGISVDSGYRGGGIGSALIGALFAWAPQHGISRIEVEAFANNPRAIALYERLGFEREGSRRSAVIVDGEPVDVVLLARRVD